MPLDGTDMNDIWTAVIAVFGVVLGAGLNELLRRNRRIESYSSPVFEKRLQKYEELMKLLHDASGVAHDVMENPKYTPEQRHALISAVILPIAEFTDQNELYIEPDLGAHCTATFMGAEDVQDIQDADEREKQAQSIRNMYMDAKRMIREDSGITEIEKLFKSMTKPKLSSPIIQRIRYLREHPEEIQREIDEEGVSPNKSAGGDA
jgi:hypothetical protein